MQMKIVLLLLAWFMLRFVYHRYTISHPKGIYYSDLGDFITAFMYQPIINLVLVLILLLSLGFIYAIIYLAFENFIERKIGNLFIYLIQLSLAIYLLVLGFVYFTELSMLLLVMLMYFIIQNHKSTRRKRIKRFRHF